MYRIFSIAVLALFALSSLSAPADFFECGYDSESPPLVLYDIPDTAMGVAIYCCWDSVGTDTLPEWAYTMWDSSYQQSVPIYYSDVTDDKMLFFGDAFGKDSSTCFVSDVFPDSDAAPSNAFISDIFVRADSVINFADYDNDGPNGIPASQDSLGDDDGYVDAVYLIEMWFWNGSGRPGITNYTTNDTSRTGDTILIGAGNGVRVRLITEPVGHHVLVHELGHTLGLYDLYSRWTDRHDSLEHRSLGSYEVMARNGFGQVSSPFTPYCKSLLGISDIITVEAPMYEVSFSDYESSDSCYKLPTVNANEYFLISAYEESENSSYWTQQWPKPDSGGILITHIKTNFSNWYEYYRKKTDIEGAHGLWNVNWTVPPQFTTENANSGRDSMDFGGVYKTHPRWDNIGNKTCLYDGVSYTAFDGLSNPNSNLYSIGGSYPQNILSHVGVRNIQVQGNGVFLADFLVNNWYDTLDGNTTWGSPTEDMGYSITGDIVVKASDTLTIEKGTTIYFQELEDNQIGGADTGRCELIVYGTLIAQGTASDSILFVPSSEQLGSPAKGDWYGIRLMPGSEGVMDYCAVRYAEYGIHMDSSSEATLSSCLVTQNDHTGIYVKEADLDLDSSVVTYNDYGVYIIDDGIARIDDSELSDNVATGVWNRPGTLVMSDCTIEDNGVMGIRGMGSIDSVYTTTISGQKYGIYWVGEDEAIFDGCVITSTGASGSYYGIYAYKEGTTNPEVYVRNDSIANFPQGGIYFEEVSEDGIITNTDVVSCETYGVYYNTSSASISGGDSTKNLFYDNTYGLYLYSSSSPTVRRTHFKNNSSYGVKVASGCSPDFGVAADSGFNSFTVGLTPGNYYDLHNDLRNDSVYAIGNWWDENPPTGAEIVNAIYKPYLQSDPLPAKLAPGLEIESIPQDFSLAKVYPNPFNPTAVIKFSLSSPQRVTVRIYNILGQEVRTLADGPMPAGQNTVIWDGRSAKGEYVSSGVYLCQMRTAQRQKTLKMTVLR